MFKPSIDSSGLESARGGSNALNWFGLALLFVTVLKLWLVSSQTLCALGPQVYDDGLFLNGAAHLLGGRWLGPYNELVLFKGPFYPMFIAASFIAGMPLLFAQQVLYVFACLVVLAAVRPLLKHKALCFCLYLFLLFNPISYASELTRLLRDGIYPALALLVTACALGLALSWPHVGRRKWCWSAGLGLSLSAYWLTREEGVWLAPVLLFYAGHALGLFWRRKPLRHGRNALLCALPFLLLAASILTVCALNWRYYRAFTVVDVKSRCFREAYGALTRVKPDHWRPNIPVPRDTLRKLYLVSPAFAELKSFYEGPRPLDWHPDPEGSIIGGWFMWSFRDAVARAGYYRTAETAEAYYRRLATEINRACDEGLLPSASGRRATLTPVFRSEYLAPMGKAFLGLFGITATYQNVVPGTNPSQGTEDSLRPFEDITNTRLERARIPETVVRGWAFSPDNAALLYSITAQGQTIPTSLTTHQRPDVRNAYQSRGNPVARALDSGFELRFPAATAPVLEVWGRGSLLAQLPLTNSTFPGLELPALKMHVESAETKVDATFLGQKRLKQLKDHVQEAIIAGYRVLNPMAFYFSLIAFPLQALVLSRCRTALFAWFFAGSILLSFCVRAALLSLLEVSLFHSIHPIYLASLYPLMTLFTVLTLSLLVELAGQLFRPRPVQEP